MQQKEPAKSRGLSGNVGYVGAWVIFLRGLRGLRGSKYFLRGQHSTWVIYFTWIAWVKYILRGSLRGSKILFTRRDYFSILQLMASRIFSRVFLKCYGGPRSTFANKLIKNTKEAKQGLVEICWEGQQILIKPCLTSSIFE